MRNLDSKKKLVLLLFMLTPSFCMADVFKDCYYNIDYEIICEEVTGNITNPSGRRPTIEDFRSNPALAEYLTNVLCRNMIMCSAVEVGDAKLVRDLLEIGSSDPLAARMGVNLFEMKSAMARAARCDQADIVDILIDFGAQDLPLALQLAVYHGSISVVKKLVEQYRVSKGDRRLRLNCFGCAMNRFSETNNPVYEELMEYFRGYGRDL